MAKQTTVHLIIGRSRFQNPEDAQVIHVCVRKWVDSAFPEVCCAALRCYMSYSLKR